MKYDFSEADQKVIERFRNTQVYKFDNTSDFKSIRECYKVAKSLYECLKYFDSRVSRFPLFSSFNNKSFNKRRSFVYPAEYYSFRYFDVLIEIQFDRRKREWFVSTTGFMPKTFKSEVDLSSGFHRYSSSTVFSEVKTSFQKIVFEFLDGAYSLGLF